MKPLRRRFGKETDKSVQEYTESISELHRAIANYGTHRVPRGKFAHATEFSTDQLIEIYENNSTNINRRII